MSDPDLRQVICRDSHIDQSHDALGIADHLDRDSLLSKDDGNLWTRYPPWHPHGEPLLFPWYPQGYPNPSVLGIPEEFSWHP